MNNSSKLRRIDSENWHVTLRKTIDERVEYPPSLPSELKKITFDCGDIEYINSAGLFRWARWANSVAKTNPHISLVFNRLPAPFIRAVAMSSDVLPPAITTVNSLFLDYLCPSCGASKKTLRKNDSPMGKAEMCESCKTKMELEMKPETYGVISKYAPKS